MRGPVVYCAEAADNGTLEGLSVRVPLEYTEEYDGYFGAQVLDAAGVKREQAALYCPLEEAKYEPCKIRFIPYYAFANRGESDRKVYLPVYR